MPKQLHGLKHSSLIIILSTLPSPCYAHGVMKALVFENSMPRTAATKILGAINVTPIITHRYRLDAYKDAFMTWWDQGKSGAVKVLFEFPASSQPL